MTLKITVLLLSLTALVNCAPGKGSSQVSGLDSSASEDNSSSSVDNAEVLAPAVDTTVNKAEVAPVVPAPSSGLSGIGSFFSSFLGGGSSTTTNSGNCGSLSSLLSLGSSFLGGGNPLVGTLVSSLAGSLTKCGSSTPLAGLIPSGSSGQDAIFSTISQLLNLKDKNKDILGLLGNIQNGKDMTGIMNILGQLTSKTQNAKILEILNMATLLQASQDPASFNCGNMNAKACEMFKMINSVRGQYGLPGLVSGAACSQAAQSHSLDMAINNFMSHIGSEGLDAKNRFAELGLTSPWAELVVKGQNLSPEDAVKALMKSTNQKKNILSGLFTSLGVGYSDGYFTTCFN